MNILLRISAATVSTGTCPTNMVPGSYSIGSCYAIMTEEMGQAEAAIKCGTTWNANLVKIESSIEENFLYQLALNSTSGWCSTCFASTYARVLRYLPLLSSANSNADEIVVVRFHLSVN